MSRDRENQSFQVKMKQFFKIIKPNQAMNFISDREYVVSDEKLKNLSKISHLSIRIKTMKELTDPVLSNRLEPYGVEKLWNSIKDIFSELNTPTELRHAAFDFLRNVVAGQFSSIDIMRAQFFRLIKDHNHPEDTAQRVDLLCTLTDYGKEVKHFEEEIAPFLLDWIPQVSQVGKLQDYLKVVDNIIKFNSPHLDQDILIGFVHNLCDLCCNSKQSEIVLLSLETLGTVPAYSILPHESLAEFVGILCRTVTVKNYCETSWKMMKNLLGTHMGHPALFIMCRFLREPSLCNDKDLMCGCVFYINKSLWGTMKIQNLARCPPSSVLPSILSAVMCNHSSVAYEAVLGIQVLIDERGSDLLEPTWDVVLSIILEIIRQIEREPNDPMYARTVGPVHTILNMIEILIKNGAYNGCITKFYSVIQECSRDRPEASVLTLINHLSKDLKPTASGWLRSLYDLFSVYFKPDVRTNIRLKVLDVIFDIIHLYGYEYEDELIERIVLPFTSNIKSDPNVLIRSAVAKLLVNLCLDYDSKIVPDILTILESLLLRPFDKNYTESDAENYDVHSLVTGLVQVFAKKIHRLPSLNAIKIYEMLVEYLEQHYKQAKTHPNTNNQIRYSIFDCFLKIRADTYGHLGYPDYSNKIRYSSYLCVTYKPTYHCQISSPPPSSPIITPKTSKTPCKVTYVSLKVLFNAIVTCLNNEKDWEVLKLVLQELPNLLRNKALIISKHGNNDMNSLVTALCSLLCDGSTLKTTNLKVTRLEFQLEFRTFVVTALTCLASYNQNLDQAHQQLLITKLTHCTGSDPRNSKQCINALMICMVDMREAMMKLLPEVLLKLSKISATNFIAMPILEFLSTLSQLPTVYANCVQEQYMTVFALALPYTSPFKYDNYIVSLAYHVIAVWFLKCRLPFRRDFVKFIVNGLKTNTAVPLQEFSPLRIGISALNQDSSDRKRSSSLTEQSSRQRSGVDSKNAQLHQTARDQTVLTFYEELNETCIDLMARYTYSPCSALPTRLPSAEFLLQGGISKSWMLGNKLITITTSGCTEKILKYGVCDKCWNYCSKQDADNLRQYARSNSNTTDSKDSPFVTRQNSGEDAKKNNEDPSKLPQLLDDDEKPSLRCACWCQGWAEVYIRRPTGNVSWIMRIQNQVSFRQQILEFPLNELSTLYMPSLHREIANSQSSIDEGQKEIEENKKSILASNSDSPKRRSLSRQSSHDSGDEDLDYIYDDGSGKSRNPVRRSNSSPEMANWKNPFLFQKGDDNMNIGLNLDEDSSKKNKNFVKDVRVSCEAIPEEISGTGTTPPSSEAPVGRHALASCSSFPGPDPKSDCLCSEPVVPNLLPLATKPPQSPTQTSPRLSRNIEKDGHAIQKTASASIVERSTHTPSKTVRPTSTPIHYDTIVQKRDRVHTISVMSTSTFRKSDKPRQAQTTGTSSSGIHKETLKSGLNPSFVFLQLYHSACFGNTSEMPLYVHQTHAIERSISILDWLYPYEIHKIGVIYVGERQNNCEADILKNPFGTIRYLEFLQNLGSLIRLADADPRLFYLGGMDRNGQDGKYMYIHQDDLVMIAYHVATLMPNKENDAHCTNKKAHIGNDNVLIVYNDSEEEYDINTIKSQVTLAYIIVQPLDYNSNRVIVKAKPELAESIGTNHPIIVSDQSVSVLVRQLALHADLAATVMNSLRSHAKDPYASSWLERLRKLKNLREKVVSEMKERKKAQRGFSQEKDIDEDFTNFT